MRLREGRGDWRPAHVIPSLRRFAFIGDSMTYGMGVAPDETLPAQAERCFNELLPAWPVEAVNLGICGYNLWNSWLGFKAMPQVYDGVVLVLCDNDAEAFGRSYHLSYPERRDLFWERAHPAGKAVARCFDDIAWVSEEASLPIAVLYYNFWDYPPSLRVAEILAELCARRNLLFIDTFPVLRGGGGVDELRVSRADGHPSARAHAATARHLAEVLRRHGWFKSDAEDPGLAPARCEQSARDMVALDQYPPEAAMAWALRVLEAKALLARRRDALDPGTGVAEAAAPFEQRLRAALRSWHVGHRLRAFMAEMAFGGFGLTHAMRSAEELRLRLAEIGYLMLEGNWAALAAPLAALHPETPDEAPPAFLPNAVLQELDESQGALDELRLLAGKCLHDGPESASDAARFFQLIARLRAELHTLDAALAAFERQFAEARPGLTAAENRLIDRLLAASLAAQAALFARLPRWPDLIEALADPRTAAYTTIELTISSPPVENHPSVTVGVQAEYAAPHRFGFGDPGRFMADGRGQTLKFHVPLFYAGRVSIHPSLPGEPGRPIQAELLNVEVYNQGQRRRGIPVGSFERNQAGFFVSPPVYLR
jgi:hypothetical protein